MHFKLHYNSTWSFFSAFTILLSSSNLFGCINFATHVHNHPAIPIHVAALHLCNQRRAFPDITLHPSHNLTSNPIAYNVSQKRMTFHFYGYIGSDISSPYCPIEDKGREEKEKIKRYRDGGIIERVTK